MKKFVKIAAIVTGFFALSLAFGAGAVRNVRAQPPPPAPEASFVVPVAAQQSGPWSVSLQGTPTVNVAALPSISGNVGIAPGTVIAVTPHVVPFFQAYGDVNGWVSHTVSTGGKIFVVEQMSGSIVLPAAAPAPPAASIQQLTPSGSPFVVIPPGFTEPPYLDGEQGYSYTQQVRLYLRDGDSIYFGPSAYSTPTLDQLILIGYLVDP
jgi:hypothetical protein